MDLRKAFHSVNRDELCRILVLRLIPPKLVKLISGLFTGTESAVMCDGTISDYFPFNTVVRQGYVLASTPSNVRMDHVLRAMSKTSGCGVYFGAVRITNPD